MSTIGLENFIETLQCLVQLLPKLTWKDLEMCAAYFEQVLSVLRTALENQTSLPSDALGDLMILPPATDGPIDAIENHAEASEDPMEVTEDPIEAIEDPTEAVSTLAKEEPQNVTENDFMVLQVIVEQDDLIKDEFQANIDLERIPQVVIETMDNSPSGDLNHTQEEIIITKQSHEGDKPSSLLTLREDQVKVEDMDSKCPVCNKLFSSRGNLQVHMRTHSEVKAFSCSFCRKQFRTKMNLQRHERCHTGDRPFECPECSKRFAEKKTMDNHLRRHTGEKPFRCTVCKERFSQNSALHFHMMRHTGQKPYSCDVCEASFRQSHQLTVHKRRRHQKTKDFECSICQKKFATKGDMARHLRTHSDDKSFLCPQCPAVFTQASSLRTHLTEHSSPLPFACAMCSVGYKTKNGLTAHQRKTGHGANREGQELMAHLLASHPQDSDEVIPLVVEAVLKEGSVECAQ